MKITGAIHKELVEIGSFDYDHLAHSTQIKATKDQHTQYDFGWKTTFYYDQNKKKAKSRRDVT